MLGTSGAKEQMVDVSQIDSKIKAFLFIREVQCITEIQNKQTNKQPKNIFWVIISEFLPTNIYFLKNNSNLRN